MSSHANTSNSVMDKRFEIPYSFDERNTTIQGQYFRKYKLASLQISCNWVNATRQFKDNNSESINWHHSNVTDNESRKIRNHKAVDTKIGGNWCCPSACWNWSKLISCGLPPIINQRRKRALPFVGNHLTFKYWCHAVLTINITTILKQQNTRNLKMHQKNTFLTITESLLPGFIVYK